MFSIFECFFSMISRAFLTFDPLSLTMAENLEGPIRSRIPSILFATNSPVWESDDKSDSCITYSLRVGVKTVKFHMDR